MEEEGDKEDPPPASPGRPSRYAFAGAVIKLSPGDFGKWQQSYSALPDLRAELTALDDWIRTESEADQKRWFFLVSGALKNKHKAALAEAKARPAGASPGYVPLDC